MHNVLTCEKYAHYNTLLYPDEFKRKLFVNCFDFSPRIHSIISIAFLSIKINLQNSSNISNDVNLFLYFNNNSLQFSLHAAFFLLILHINYFNMDNHNSWVIIVPWFVTTVLLVSLFRTKLKILLWQLIETIAILIIIVYNDNTGHF